MRIKELDGLRGIAVLTVVAHHYMLRGTKNGWLGVDLFFILSGFLITSILINLRNKTHYFSTFYARRSLRIFPPYFLALAIYLVVSFAMNQPGTFGLWSRYIFYYTSLIIPTPCDMLPCSLVVPVSLGLSVLWSLSVEEIYYTIWAPIVRWTSHRVFTGILLAMILTAPLLRWWLYSPDYLETFTFYCRMDALAMGSMVALAIAGRRNKARAWLRVDRYILPVAVVIVTFSVCLWIALHANRSNIVLSTIGLSLADLSFALLAYLVIRNAGGSFWPLRVLRTPWLRSIGTVSYSLYLFHYPVYGLIGGWFKRHEISGIRNSLLVPTLSFTISLLIAYALWYSVESRILHWKDRYVPSGEEIRT